MKIDIVCENYEHDFIEATGEVQILQSASHKLPALMSKYVDLFTKSKYDVRHVNIEPHRIYLTWDLLISLRPYRTSPIEEEKIRKQVQSLLQSGILKESYSPYSSLVTLVYKHEEGKTTYLFVDFIKLSAITKTDAEPLPKIYTFLDKLAQAKVFSTLDLASGYWHISTHPKDTEKLAFAYLPFGLKKCTCNF